MSFFLRKCFIRYDAALRQQPILVKSITSAVILSSSDITAQCLKRRLHEKKSIFGGNESWYNPYQTLAAGIAYGALWFTPLMHNVFLLWARILPSTSFPVVMLKTAVDNVTRSNFDMPLSKKIENVQASLKEKLWPAVKVGWLIWPAVTLLNYKFVPIIYRLLLLNSVSYCWNVGLILSTTPDVARIFEA